MKAKKAQKEFHRHLAGRGEALATLTPERGLDAMLSFYRDVRAVDCDIAEQGDMLLYQWGIYDWGKGPRFDLDITRQLIVRTGEDDDIWQLHLPFRFEPSGDLEALGRGDRWCESPQDLSEFAAFARSHTAFTAVADRSDGALDFYYEQAG